MHVLIPLGTQSKYDFSFASTILASRQLEKKEWLLKDFDIIGLKCLGSWFDHECP